MSNNYRNGNGGLMHIGGKRNDRSIPMAVQKRIRLLNSAYTQQAHKPNKPPKPKTLAGTGGFKLKRRHKWH